MKAASALVGAGLAPPRLYAAGPSRVSNGLVIRDSLDSVLPGQASVDLSVIVSKRKMFSAVIIVMGPKEREWNL